MIKKTYGLKLANYGDLIIANKNIIKEGNKELSIKEKVLEEGIEL